MKTSKRYQKLPYRIASIVLAMAFTCSLGRSQAVVPPTTPYGKPIALESAKLIAAAAHAEAAKNHWFMSIAVVDPAGMLVYFENMDGVQHGSGDVAIDKAKSAALYRRPTKVFQDAVAGGGAGLRFLALRGAVPLDGGIPIVVKGEIIGAVGISGGAGEQDGQCAQAAASTNLESTINR
jgi:glc operon protein GlcG